MNIQEAKRDIIEAGRRVYQQGYVASNDGNISCRLDEERILTTPTGMSKGFLEMSDLVVVNYEGKKVSGSRNPSSEIGMHLFLYNERPDINAVVHAHPPVATGFASAGRSLNKALLPEVIIGLGCVPTAAYGLPGTPALTEGMMPLIPKYDALLLANHGAVSYGKDVWQAFFRMETVEHFARINFVAEMLGGAQALPRTEVDKLFDSRTRYGVRSKAVPVPGCPTVAEDHAADGSGGAGSDGIYVTRDELVQLIDEAVKAREATR